MNKKNKTVTIVGAGITGCFLAVILAKKGYVVTVYERSSFEEIISNASKRSFNLTLYGYSVEALKKVGLWEAVAEELIVLMGSVTQVGKSGKPIFVSFHDDMEYYTIQRSQLLKIFIREASAYPNITFHFATRVIFIDKYNKQLLLRQGTKSSDWIPYTLLFGADGANSLVRSFMQRGQDSHHLQTYAQSEYKQIVIPKEIVTQLRLQSGMQYVWTRKQATVIAFPTKEGSYSALFMLEKNSNEGFDRLIDKQTTHAFLKKDFPELQVATEVFIHDVLHNPCGGFVTVTTAPWFYSDSMAIVGDAAHACLPFYGIGMSVGFGDCLLLDALIEKYNENWEKILPLYQEKRKLNTDVIGKLCTKSLDQFKRDKIADYISIYDKVENILHSILPHIFLPPLFHLVVTDPEHAEEMYQKHCRQRKIYSLLGLSFIVRCMTLGVGLYEKVASMRVG